MPPVNPMDLGLVIAPSGDPEEYLRRVHDLGFSNCFLSLDKYIGSFTPALAKQYRDLLAKMCIRDRSGPMHFNSGRCGKHLIS